MLISGVFTREHQEKDSADRRTIGRRLRRNLSWLGGALGFTGAYAAWIGAFKLLVLTLVTYFLVSASSYGVSGPARLQDISEAFGSAEILTAGFSALGFVVLLRLLYPVVTVTTAELTGGRGLDVRFIPGFLRGAVLALGITLAFLASGHYRYLGMTLQMEDSTVAALSVLARVAALVAMVYFEEYLFRHRLLAATRRRVPDLYAVPIVALLYCGIKLVQFDLGIMHLFTLFLVSTYVGFRSVSGAPAGTAPAQGAFIAGAGFWAGLLVTFHALFGLPILGNEFSGVMLIKYEGAAGLMSGFLGPLSPSTDSRTALFVTGGIGGPLSSFALQFFLILLIGGQVLRRFSLKGLKPSS